MLTTNARCEMMLIEVEHASDYRALEGIPGDVLCRQ